MFGAWRFWRPLRTRLNHVADGPTLRDRTVFWLGLAAALAAIGAVPAGIAAAAASAAHKGLLSSIWFDAGVAAIGLAVASSLWSLILYVAHSHAEKHWCPDPSAHVLPRQVRESQEAIASVSGIEPRISQIGDEEKIRSVLRALRLDVRDAARRIENTIKTGRYWPSAGNDGGPLPDRTWKKNRGQLSGIAGMGEVYDSLYEAYAEIDRINAFHFARVAFHGSQIKPGDRLDDALRCLRDAEDKLSAKLLGLGA
jgi:hypothetical protein